MPLQPNGHRRHANVCVLCLCEVVVCPGVLPVLMIACPPNVFIQHPTTSPSRSYATLVNVTPVYLDVSGMSIDDVGAKIESTVMAEIEVGRPSPVPHGRPLRCTVYPTPARPRGGRWHLTAKLTNLFWVLLQKPNRPSETLTLW